MSLTPLAAVLCSIDDANAADPNLECCDGREWPAALLYGHRMSAELLSSNTDPSEALQIAVRGQHIERWLRPRDDYPTGRGGYLNWRRDAGRYHATRIAEIMRQHGYGDAGIDRVGALIRKEGIKTSSETQALEDAACLVFMRWYVEPFARKHELDAVLDIVGKTARKMSPSGRRLALKLPLSNDVKAEILKADVQKPD